MKTYQDLYKVGMKHLDEDLFDIVRVLDSGECVCLCSPNMGDTVLLGYLCYFLRRNSSYHLIYDEVGDLDEVGLKKKLNGKKSQRVVVIIPKYSRKSRAFRDFFRAYVARPTTDVLSAIGMRYDFLEDPGMYFDSGKPMSYVKIRKPLNFRLTLSVISAVQELNGWHVPSKFTRDIHKLSGGVISLTKHVCGFINRDQEIDVQELLCYPPLVRALADMKIAFDILNPVHLKKLGYLRANGVVRGALLDRYLRSGSVRDEYDLAPSLQRIFDLLKSKAGEIVTLDEIDESLKKEGDFSLWGTYKLISRLRSEVKDKYEVKNIKGKGYILKERGYEWI